MLGMNKDSLISGSDQVINPVIFSTGEKNDIFNREVCGNNENNELAPYYKRVKLDNKGMEDYDLIFKDCFSRKNQDSVLKSKTNEKELKINTTKECFENLEPLVLYSKGDDHQIDNPYPHIEFTDLENNELMIKYVKNIQSGTYGLTCMYEDNKYQKYAVKFFFPIEGVSEIAFNHEKDVLTETYKRIGYQCGILSFRGYSRIFHDTYRHIVLLRELKKKVSKILDIKIDINLIISNFIEGEELFSIITDKKPTLQAELFYKELDIYHMIMSLMSDVSYLHKSDIVHCDIKPENIIIDNDKKYSSLGDRKYTLIDFGTSNIKNVLLYPAGISGTEGYIPGFLMVDIENSFEDLKYQDLYSLVVTLYVCLTGCMPFDEKKLDYESIYQPIDRKNMSNFKSEINKDKLEKIYDFCDKFFVDYQKHISSMMKILESQGKTFLSDAVLWRRELYYENGYTIDKVLEMFKNF